ncbi:MAG: DUF308 domain-containing protein [Clostridia bacterium]|nr:DUF308 domain-containing protein [Clostridia bacterium]
MLKKLSSRVGTLMLAVGEILLGVLFLSIYDYIGTLIVIFGAALTLIGVVNVILYFIRNPLKAAEKHYLSLGLFLILAGVFCVMRYDLIIGMFTDLFVIFGVLMLVVGISKLELTINRARIHDKSWRVHLLSTILTIAAAVFVIADPVESSDIIRIVFAVSLIIEGAADILALLLAGEEKPKQTENGATDSATEN